MKNYSIYGFLLLLLASNAFAQYNFYFLAPTTDEWKRGIPYLVWQNGTEPQKLTADNRCGWFKITFPDGVPEGTGWVWLNKDGAEDNRIGDKGLAEDPVEWVNGNPTPFNLAERFDGHPNTFFDPKEGIWSSTDPGTKGECGYKFAAVIYHTSDSANSSFSMYNKCGNKPENTNNCRSTIRDGVTKGIAKYRLGANGKIEFESDQGTDWKAENFETAFKNTPGKNVQRCYNMPFTRRGDAWEFDALYLCQNGEGVGYDGTCATIGGFYPPSLTRNIDEYGDYTDQYAALPRLDNANTDDDRRRRLYNGQKNVRPQACVNMWCFDRGWYGGNCTSGGRAIPTENHTHPDSVGNLDWVNSSTTKDEIDDYMKTKCYEPFRSYPDNPLADGRGDFVGTSIPIREDPWGNSPSVSGLMCFESAPAKFIYEPGQEFFFRGDDDIWVYINNQLVVDIGGNHNPAPGYVKLDTIKPALVKGTEYPINIFFCDRRNSGSNIRITTNMYFSQNTGLYVDEGKGSANSPAKLCMETGGGGSCEDLGHGGTGGSKQTLCGLDIKDEVMYFIENRKGDLSHNLWVPPGDYNSECTVSGTKLTCFGGVVIDLNAGTALVDKEKITGITGSWTLYARVKDRDDIERVKIASWSYATSVRMAWGTLVDYQGNPLPEISNICNYERRQSTAAEAKAGKGYAVTGELFPVCFSVGEHNSSGSFEVDEEGAAGSSFSLNLDGFKNEFGLYTDKAGLVVYLDSNGTAKIPFDEISRNFTIPSNGVLVLWVTGGYEQKKGEWPYTINVKGKTSDEVTLVSMLPRFQWIRALGYTDSIPACSRTVFPAVGYGSKFNLQGCPVRGADGKLDFVWVGEDVKLNMRAYNEKTKKTCKTCNFPLRLTAQAHPATSEATSALISSPPLKIVNGEAGFAIQGRRESLLPNWITINVTGSESDLHQVTWDTLQFRKPPVPIPERSEIYDDDGDGIGDRLVMVYSRGFRRDSLPNMLEVKWDADTTVLFGEGTFKNNQYVNVDIVGDTLNKWTGTKAGGERNFKYWSPYIKLGRLKNGQLLTETLDKRDATITEAQIEEVRDTIILKGKFSKDVLTQGEGKVTNWATFKAGSNAASTTPLTGNIDEKIPAIVTKARYTVGENCKNTAADRCLDKVVITFSEPIKMDTNAVNASDEAIRNPFAYWLVDAYTVEKVTWDILKPEEVPTEARIKYGNKTGIRPVSDSTVTLTFGRYRDGDNKSGTPMPGDSVKFASLGKGYSSFLRNILVDLKENPPNKNEKGRKIEGQKPFNREKMPIGFIDPNYEKPGYVKDILEAICNANNSSSCSYGDTLSFFSKDRPIEMIPVPDGWGIEQVRKEFPGTVGMLFNPDIANVISELETNYGVKINDSNITIYSKVFYHTNLGNYVAGPGDRFPVKCNDKIFPISPITGEPSCKDSKSKLYVAWDMKDFKGRFVGTGAYVGIYDFHWEVTIPAGGKGEGTVERMDKIERRVEMHGVKRVKLKK